MGANSHIEWTKATWNPVTGCSKVSAGCKNCYAERRLRFGSSPWAIFATAMDLESRSTQISS